ncbi:MAG: carboxypeptidase-like regulatory domain-containing protein, partial [Bacteroidales bacterium]|nr:carboxypeptidase-like regulatory domain-containing protein [Bacteroidales bacterium]
MRILISLLIIAALSIPASLRAEGDEPDKTKKTISGFVKDAETGEDLIGATIYIEELKSGTVTNTYGYYSIRLEQDKYTL